MFKPKAEDLETTYAALETLTTTGLFKWWPMVDRAYFKHEK